VGGRGRPCTGPRRPREALHDDDDDDDDDEDETRRKAPARLSRPAEALRGRVYWASTGPLLDKRRRKAESTKRKADHMRKLKLTAAHKADKNTKLIAAERPKAPNKAEPRAVTGDTKPAPKA